MNFLYLIFFFTLSAVIFSYEKISQLAANLTAQSYTLSRAYYLKYCSHHHQPHRVRRPLLCFCVSGLGDDDIVAQLHSAIVNEMQQSSPYNCAEHREEPRIGYIGLFEVGHIISSDDGEREKDPFLAFAPH